MLVSDDLFSCFALSYVSRIYGNGESAYEETIEIIYHDR